MNTDELLTFQKNITSQCGEDGVIEEICRRLCIEKGFFVEFGAWDGKYLSNTYSLLNKGWKGLYIEKDMQKFQDLVRTKDEYPKQLEINCSEVSIDGENSFDQIASKTSTPKEFELLSIDIDSYDWQIWNSICDYHPKLVIIEGNSTILPGVWQVHIDGICQGSSFTALVALGEHKGYKLVCHTGNLFFVKKELVNQLCINPVNLLFPETLFNYKKHFEELQYQRTLLIPKKISYLNRFSRKIKRILKKTTEIIKNS